MDFLHSTLFFIRQVLTWITALSLKLPRLDGGTAPNSLIINESSFSTQTTVIRHPNSFGSRRVFLPFFARRHSSHRLLKCMAIVSCLVLERITLGVQQQTPRSWSRLAMRKIGGALWAMLLLLLIPYLHKGLSLLYEWGVPSASCFRSKLNIPGVQKKLPKLSI